MNKYKDVIFRCTNGDHPLVEIYVSGGSYDAYDVVRWCPICGSVVVDKDFDGRTNAGQVMRMKSPVLSNIIANEQV